MVIYDNSVNTLSWYYRTLIAPHNTKTTKKAPGKVGTLHLDIQTEISRVTTDEIIYWDQKEKHIDKQKAIQSYTTTYN